ncbi:MAG: SAM-dependent DNA methyltransferase [Gemmatimonadetes bacterium]|nr:SAM-dependent DNA methyltransferase [Gemmatimonadota bacterium]MCY3942456.1 SAM-dependent DNA methyltransferase [Gemmatimonadota bacterium]
MTPLPPDLRTLLARAIQQARRVGESGASQALQSLAVDRAKPFDSMSLGDKSLRNRLRRRGRQAGDRRDRETGTQNIGHLAHEVAYEHWHRMLFARFLAENGLLRDPEHGVDLSLDDCRDLAEEEGTDAWEFAGRCAGHMLPEIFRSDDPVLDLSLPPETRQELEGLLDGLPEAVFAAPDSLGWTYQFWQAERKGEVNRSGGKIGADELPAVTQLFTETYMVRFLLHNTVGAWRAGRLLADRPDLAESADDEDGLRRLARIDTAGGYDFSYLRFVRGVREEDGDDERTGPWRPAAGSFPEWPGDAAALRVLDPCCGSGHFLVEAFELLVRLRMAEENLQADEAIRLVLRDNLFGLEIDPRCTQIAAFNLALAAWRLAGEPIDLPPLNVACAGLAPNASEAEWRERAVRAESSTGLAADRDLFGAEPSLASGVPEEGMARLHKLFGRAPELGSLLDPASQEGDLFRADYRSLAELLTSVIRPEQGSAGRDERAVAAAGMARAAEILQGRYTLVVTNVPFLARGKQGSGLRTFAETHHGDAKGDLATMFVSRIFGWLGRSGTQAVVSPQNWLFLKTYRKLRERLLKGRTWNMVARLGPGAFETVSGEVVNVALDVISAGRPDRDWEMAGVDVSSPRGQRPIKAAEKGERLRGEGGVVVSRQGEQVRNPDSVVLMRPIGDRVLLGNVAHGHQGIASADYPSFGRLFWEIPTDGETWAFQQSTVNDTTDFGGREHVLHWTGVTEGAERQVAPGGRKAVRIQGGGIWSRNGIAVSQIGQLPVTRYTGEKFDNNTAALGPLDDDTLPAVWCFCSSPEYAASVREIDQKLNVTNATLVKVPFDLDHWKTVAAEQYPNGLPEPYSDDPTQWIFHGDPCRSVVWNEQSKRTDHGPPRIDATVLHVAVARLLGYRWPAELDPDLRLAPEQRDVAHDCRAFDDFADSDGIVCVPSVRGEPPAADRLRSLLASAYGDEWSAATERALLTATSPRPPKSLEDWVRDRFFQEHCKLFHNRPFIWHVWDGRNDGFHALVNYHRLAGPEGQGRRTLESLNYAYLHEWIARQRTESEEGTPGADGRLAAALDLQEQLQRILAGEPPCDIFVRWRPLHGQAIVWEPNINDGVRLNIRPFMRAELRKGGRAGAGILRWKPNIKWGKDRGKEPEAPRPRDDFPWFWGCPGGGSERERTDFQAETEAEFDGSRWNDLHYSASCKNAARHRSRDQGTTS